MSQTIDDRIVQLEFDNDQFEKNVSESLTTLQKLKQSLNLESSAKNLTALTDASKKVDFSTLADSVDKLSERFSTMRMVGLMALSNIVDGAMNAAKGIGKILTAPIQQMKTGGWNRAANLEQANFMLKGLLKDADKVQAVMKDVNTSVDGTAYSLDEAAKVAAQFAASGLQAGKNMLPALRAVAGTAAMTNSSFADIGQIFTTVAGQGKLMTYQMRQLEFRGLNVAATLGEQMGKTEAEIRDMVTKGKISFEDFAEAMEKAFGDHAQEANNTFQGALSNMKSALNRIGAEFATPIMRDAIPVFNSLRLMINAIKGSMGDVFYIFDGLSKALSGKLVRTIDKITAFLNGKEFKTNGLVYLNKALYITMNTIIRIGKAISTAFSKVFNGSMGDHINKLAQGLYKIAQVLSPTESGLKGFTDVLTVIFSIIKKVGQVIGFVLSKIGGPLLKVLAGITHVIFGLIGAIDKILSKLGEFLLRSHAFRVTWLKINEILFQIKGVFSNLKSDLHDTSTIIGKAAQMITKALKYIALGIAGIIALPIYGIYLGFQKLQTLDFSKVIDALTKLKDLIIQFIKYVYNLPIVKTIINGVVTGFFALVGGIAYVVNGIKNFITALLNGEITIEYIKRKISELPGFFSDIWDKILNAFVGNSLVEKLKDAKKAIDDFLTDLKNKVIDNPVFQAITNAFTNLGEMISKWASGLKYRLQNLTPAKMVLASFAVFAMMLAVNMNKMVDSLVGLVGTASDAIGSISDFLTKKKSKLEKFTTVVITLSIAVLALAGAFKIMSDIESTKLNQIAIILGSFVAGFLALSFAISKLDKNGKFSGDVKAIGMALAGLGVTLLMIANALHIMNNVPATKSTLKKVGILALVLMELAGFAVILRFFGPQTLAQAAGLVAFAFTIHSIANALAKLSGIDFTGIKGAWKEIGILILGLAALSSVLAAVGVGAFLGVVAYLLIARTLMQGLEKFADDGTAATESMKKFRNSLKLFTKNLKEGFKTFKEEVIDVLNPGELFATVTLVTFAIGLVIAIITTIFRGLLQLSTAAKGIRKLAVSFVLISAAIAGLMYFAKYMAEWSRSVSDSTVKSFYIMTTIVGAMILLVGAFMALSHFAQPEALGAVKKIFTSLGFIFIGMASMMLTLSLLDETQIAAAERIITNSLEIIGLFIILSSTISALSASDKAGFGHFAGLTLLFATMLGALAVLMYVIQDEEDIYRLIASVLAIVSLVAVLGFLFRSIGKIHYKASWATLIVLLVGLGLIAAEIVALAHWLPEGDYIKKIATVATTMLVVLAALAGLVLFIQKMDKNKRFSITKESANTIRYTFTAIAELMVGFLIIAAAMKILEGVNAGRMIGQAGTIVLVLGALSALVLALQHFDKNSKFSITKTSAETLKGTFMGIAALITAFVVIAGAMKLLEGVNAGRMIAQSQVITLVILELAGLMLAIQWLTKKFKLKADAGMILTLLGMTAIFAALAVVMSYVATISGTSDRMLAVSQVIMLVLAELSAIVILFGKLGKEGMGLTALSVLPALLGLTVLFGALALVIAVAERIGGKADRMLAVSQVIMLVLAELSVIMLIFAAIASSGVGALGMLGSALALPTLLGLVVLFGALGLIIAKMNELDLEGVRPKLLLVEELLWQLVAITAIFALLSVGAIGELAGAGSILLIALGIKELVSALAQIQDIGIEDVASGLELVAQAIEMLSKSGVGLMVLGAGLIVLAAGIASVGIACMIASPGIMMLSAALMSLFTTLSIIVPAITEAASGAVEAFRTKFEELKEIPGDIMQAVSEKIQSLLGTFENAGASMANALLGPFRKILGWHSPPEFIVKFFTDCGIAVNQNAKGVTDLFDDTGYTWGTALEEALGTKLGSIDLSNIGEMLGSQFGISLFDSASGPLNSLMGLFGNLLNLNAKTQKELVESYRTGKMSATEFNSKMAELNKTNKDGKGILDDLTKGLGDFTKGAKGASSATKDFQETLTSTLTNQLNIFSKFEQKNPMNKDELLNNMKSQIKGMTDWANNMNKLATMGIDQGLYKKLAEMGPEGAEYVGAFVSMSAEELGQANELWAESLVLPGAVAKQIGVNMNEVGQNTLIGFQNGLDAQTNQTLTQLGVIAQDGVTTFAEGVGVASPSWKFQEIAEYCMIGLYNGFNRLEHLPIDAVERICKKILNKAKEILNPEDFKKIGSDAVEGIKLGIEEMQDEVTQMLETLGQKMLEAIKSKKALNEKSPSHAMEEIGEYAVLGLANGIDKKSGIAVRSITDMGSEVVSQMKMTIANIASMINDEMEDPVITPVLDLSKVQAGARLLNSTFSANAAIAAGGSQLGALQNGQYSQGGITFNQYNNSPKALSRIDIYRDTRNMLSQFKQATT